MSREVVDQYAVRAAVFDLETFAKHLDCSTEKDWLRIPDAVPRVTRDRLVAARDVLEYFGMVIGADDSFHIDRDHPLYASRRDG